MAEYHFTTPVTDREIGQLRAGDTLYLSGTVFTARDEAHMELIAHGGIQGFDMTGLGLYHCGPVMMRTPGAAAGDAPGGPGEPGEPAGAVVTGQQAREGGAAGGWSILSAGPTTSFRMESLEPRFLDLFGVKVIIGKGGMGPRTLEALRKHTVVYAAFTGGAGALAARGLGRVKGVHYLEELGMAEAVWVFEAREFGPLVVSMDSHGGSLYEGVDRTTGENLRDILKERGLD